MNQRRRAVLVVVALVAVAGVAVAADTLTAETRGTVPVGVTTGPTAGVTADRTDLTGIGKNATAARINTSAGDLLINGTDGSYARIDRFEGPWTNVSDVDTAGGQLWINPDDKQTTRLARNLTGLAWQPTSEMALDDGSSDFWYNASGPASVTLGGFAPDTKVAAMAAGTSTPQILDTATTTATGRVTFDSLDSGKAAVRVRKKPEALYVRNESNPSEQVGGPNNPVSVEIRFFLGDDTDAPNQIVTRETTDGTINMTGLPANESFVVVADAENYTSRRIFVESLYQQETVYLLPDTVVSVQKLYQLRDFTGFYPQDISVLKVQRGINGSWQTVQGDYFGASGEFEAVFKRGERHRLVILNTQTERRRVLGRVKPLTSGTQTIEVNSRDDIDLSRLGPIPSALPSTRALPAGQTSVTVSVDPLRSDLVEWNYTVDLVDPDGTTQQLATDTLNEGGTASPSFNLTNESASTVRVSVGWETADGRSMLTNYSFRIVPDYEGYSLLDGLLGFPTLFSSSSDASAATSMISLLFAVFGGAATALKFRASTEGVGLVIVGILAVFSIVGWIGYAVVFASGVAWTALVATRRGL